MAIRNSLAPRRYELVAYRQLYGYSQRKLAAKARISPFTLCRIENGQSRPTCRTVEALAEALDLPVHVLFPNEDQERDRCL